MCQLYCQDILYALPAFGFVEACHCEENFTWDGDVLECVIQCEMFANTTGELEPESYHRCLCKDKFEWVEAEMQCVQTVFDYALLAIVGSGVICNLCFNAAFGAIAQITFVTAKKALAGKFVKVATTVV